MKELDVRYLERLSQLYPSSAKASTEIINLQAMRISTGNMRHFPMCLRTVRVQCAAKSMMSSGIL